MPLTKDLELPSRPQASEPWTKKTLLAIQTTAQLLAKNFNALEVVLLFMVFVSGLGELLGRRLSWGWYLLLVLVLASNIYLRVSKPERTETKTKE